MEIFVKDGRDLEDRVVLELRPMEVMLLLGTLDKSNGVFAHELKSRIALALQKFRKRRRLVDLAAM